MIVHQSEATANYLGLKSSKTSNSNGSAKRSHCRLPTSLLPTVDLSDESLINPAPQKKPKAASTQSKLLVSKPGKEGHAAMNMAIADYFHSNAVPYRHAECPKFANMLQAARSVGEDYKPPTRQEIGGDLLNANYDTSLKGICNALMRDAENYGLTVRGVDDVYP